MRIVEGRARLVIFWLCLPAIPFSQSATSLPGGTFTMGNDRNNGDEMAHTVTVSAFSIDRYEVAIAQYDSCVRQGRCTPAHYDDGNCMLWTSNGFRRVRVPIVYRDRAFPVTCVTWQQAREYCQFRGGRLPTEAEWEYAAKAGTSHIYAWGDAEPQTNLCAQPAEAHPRKTGSSLPNAWHLYDMTGNVWEWVNDRYQVDYYSISQRSDPFGPEVGRYRVIRGGGWYSKAEQLRVSNRHWFAPEFGEASIGFRCAY